MHDEIVGPAAEPIAVVVAIAAANTPNTDHEQACDDSKLFVLDDTRNNRVG